MSSHFHKIPIIKNVKYLKQFPKSAPRPLMVRETCSSGPRNTIQTDLLCFVDHCSVHFKSFGATGLKNQQDLKKSEKSLIQNQTITDDDRPLQQGFSTFFQFATHFASKKW